MMAGALQIQILFLVVIENVHAAKMPRVINA